VICPHRSRAFRYRLLRATLLQHLRIRVPACSSTASLAPKLAQTIQLRVAGPCAGARRRSLRVTSAPPLAVTLSRPRSAHTGAMPFVAARRFSVRTCVPALFAPPVPQLLHSRPCCPLVGPRRAAAAAQARYSLHACSAHAPASLREPPAHAPSRTPALQRPASARSAASSLEHARLPQRRLLPRCPSRAWPRPTSAPAPACALAPHTPAPPKRPSQRRTSRSPPARAPAPPAPAPCQPLPLARGRSAPRRRPALPGSARAPVPSPGGGEERRQGRKSQEEAPDKDRGRTEREGKKQRRKRKEISQGLMREFRKLQGPHGKVKFPINLKP
jgi:hypothetical protein